MHRAALAAVDLPGTYEAWEVAPDGFAAAIGAIRSGRLDGANVTMPHKVTARRAVDRTTPPAGRSGAVNTIVRVGDELIGHNTDIGAIERAWASLDVPDDTPVTIVGAGGAAAAAAVALADRSLQIAVRRPESGQDLIDRLGLAAPVVDLGASPAVGSVVVNATPLGMQGEKLPPALIGDAAGLIDFPYGNRPTPAVITCRAGGVPVVDGVDLLVHQAVGSFRLWTGRAVSPSTMRAAAVAELEQLTAHDGDGFDR